MSTKYLDLTGLSDENIERVRQYAEQVRAETGQPVPAPPDGPSKLSVEEWLKRFDAWAGGITTGPVFRIDSETVYGDDDE